MKNKVSFFLFLYNEESQTFCFVFEDFESKGFSFPRVDKEVIIKNSKFFYLRIIKKEIYLYLRGKNYKF